MSIQDRLVADMKDAMRAGDKARVVVIRTTRAALQSAQLEAAKQRYDAAARAIEAQHAHDAEARDAALSAISADAHVALDQAAAEAVIAKEIKRRRDAAEIYHKASREDLAGQEEAEAAILEAYLPRQMSVEELRPAVADLIAELGLSGPSSMGKLMPALMERFKGRAEGRLLSQVARELLAGS
ncbi:GatB/YqeY domain-containing protein [Oscillochloris sp. ZM17-4]|uniref:GatB/YqeY domain-containing protein n=1 Tax=Oscillochloris sp. ZM17-4 TaxID=2866714 RepID=UPI001C739C43|nr:GatB/YqeY domain-containing protein [Oscillochloris sp. ZM17-4]MBX0329861.1 GatB/YqeY domain-containing protein [Oscillochloris sp. ZM17-4]